MYQEKNKTKINKPLFYILIFYSTLICFLVSFAYCVKHIGGNLTTLKGTLFAFTIPPLIAILITSILTLVAFPDKYMNKRELSKVKEILSYISVFSVVLVNTIEKFYTPTGDNTETKGSSWISKQIFEFINLSIQEINYVYTLPIIFSVFTLILLILENTRLTTNRKRKVMMCPPTYPRDNKRHEENMKRVKQIIEETKIIRQNTFTK